MNLLLDTQVVIWSLNQPERVPGPVRRAIESASNQIWVSAISIWEMATKTQIGKLRMPDNVVEGVAEQGFRMLDFTAEHGLKTSALPLRHGDPFDRALLAQALANRLRLVTADQRLREYAPEVQIEFIG